MPEKKRRDARVNAALPVNVGGRVAGVTRDVSASGVFFETDEEMSQGSTIRFTLEMENGIGKFLLRCKGEIVRVEAGGARRGVAAKIIECKLEALGDQPVKFAGRESPSDSLNFQVGIGESKR